MASRKMTVHTADAVVETPQSEAPANEASITLSFTDAKRLYELYSNVETADEHFHTCQSENFRQHLRGVYKAKNVSNAFAKLKEFIDAQY